MINIKLTSKKQFLHFWLFFDYNIYIHTHRLKKTTQTWYNDNERVNKRYTIILF